MVPVEVINVHILHLLMEHSFKLTRLCLNEFSIETWWIVCHLLVINDEICYIHKFVSKWLWRPFHVPNILVWSLFI